MQEVNESISREIARLQPDIIAFLQRLVQFRSLPGCEQALQLFIADKLRALGFDVAVLKSELADLAGHPAFSDDAVPFVDRLNIVGTWNGTGAGEGRSLILNGHVDVVPTGNEESWRLPPWAGVVEDGRLHGRGSCDMKAGVTAAIFACEALRNLRFEPAKNITVETVIGEESGGVGTLTTLVKGVMADAVIITEPTELEICPVQAGSLSFRIKIMGRAIHASMKHLGVSAVEKFCQVFVAIQQLDRERHARYSNSLFEYPENIAPINIGILRAGDWPSTVPDELFAEGRLGVFPGQSTDDARAELVACLVEVAASDDWLAKHPPELEWFEGQFESGETPTEEPVIQCLSKCHADLVGKAPEFRGVTWGSDLRLFTNHGKIPAVLYGPGDVALAHTVEESVDLAEVFTSAEVLAHTITRWCGGEFRR